MGSIQVAILSKDAKRFLASEVVREGTGWRLVDLVVKPDDLKEAGDVLFANGLDSNDSSSASIRSVRIVRPGPDARTGLLGETLARGVVVPRQMLAEVH